MTDERRLWMVVILTILVATLGMASWVGGVFNFSSRFSSRFSSQRIRSSKPSFQDLVNQNESSTNPQTSDPDLEYPVPVQVIRPRRGKAGFIRSVTEPAVVHAAYKADLMARVAGVVKWIHKNIGEEVKEGEVLLELDVPDLIKDLAHKEALVVQAEQDLRSSHSNIEITEAAAREAQAQIREKQAEIDRARSMETYRQAEYNRVRQLAEQQAVIGGLMDEKLQALEAAKANLRSSLVMVETARANGEEFGAKVKHARVDVEVKKSRVAVARADRDRAQVMVDYARIRAPFHGRIVSRRVDPGSFVQKASTGQGQPLLTVMRLDKVKLVMWVPEKAAPLVTAKTEAIIQLDALSEHSFRAKVSRYSHYFDPEKSRDMRVEVDLDNPGEKLRVGMYGSMTLVLERLDHDLLVPSGAVALRDGKTFLCQVSNGRVRFIPVRVQLDDGIRCKVVRLVRRQDRKTKQMLETLESLKGEEIYVHSGHGELNDGQAVEANVVEW